MALGTSDSKAGFVTRAKLGWPVVRGPHIRPLVSGINADEVSAVTRVLAFISSTCSSSSFFVLLKIIDWLK